MTGPELSLYVTFDATLGKAGTSIALLRITTRLGSGTGMETLVGFAFLRLRFLMDFM